MRIVPNVANDYLFVDNTQSISYFSATDDNVFSMPRGAIGLKSVDTKTYDEFGGVELSSHRCIWYVWNNSFGTPTVPKRGDKFTASTITGVETWIVESAEYDVWSTMFTLGTYQEGMNA